MSTMISEVYDALKEAGASEEAARAASSALSSDNASLKSDISRLQTDVSAVKTKLDMLQWMLGLSILLTLGVLWRLLAA